MLFESVCIEMFEVAASPHIILRRFQAILGKDAVNLVIRHLVPPAFSIEGASRSSTVAGRRGDSFPHNETSFDVAPPKLPGGETITYPRSVTPFSIVVGYGVSSVRGSRSFYCSGSQAQSAPAHALNPAKSQARRAQAHARDRVSIATTGPGIRLNPFKVAG